MKRAMAEAGDAVSFEDYATKPGISVDETYTLELLIDRVRSEFDDGYFDEYTERLDARNDPAYRPSFAREHVKPAAERLVKLAWVSLQRLGDKERPVRDLQAMRFLPGLTGLVLTGNEVADVKPLRHCRNLKRLSLDNNPIKDIAPLRECSGLEKLSLRGCPIENFSVLQSLPNLKMLEISGAQALKIGRKAHLPFLQKLDLSDGQMASFEGLPEMPALRVICGAKVKSLEGLDRFPKLEALVNLDAQVDALEPLAGVPGLTHLNIQNTCARSLAPLGSLPHLRDLWLETGAGEIDLAPLGGLPRLRDVTVKCDGKDAVGLDVLRKGLASWDVEFLSDVARHMPSLRVEVVPQKDFDLYDTVEPYGITDADNADGLLESELQWLDKKLDGVLGPKFKEDEDYALPFRWGGARSRTVVLLSEEAVEDFPRLVLGMQRILSHARNDWILYFQSDVGSEDFIVWVYPEKIVTTSEHAERVKSLAEIPH